jgi:hypothetical protein
MDHAAHMGTLKSAYKIVFRKPEEKRPLGQYEHRGEDLLKPIFKRNRL